MAQKRRVIEYTGIANQKGVKFKGNAVKFLKDVYYNSRELQARMQTFPGLNDARTKFIENVMEIAQAISDGKPIREKTLRRSVEIFTGSYDLQTGGERSAQNALRAIRNDRFNDSKGRSLEQQMKRKMQQLGKDPNKAQLVYDQNAKMFIYGGMFALDFSNSPYGITYKVLG